jgi:hypothetical protein
MEEKEEETLEKTKKVKEEKIKINIAKKEDKILIYFLWLFTLWT